jgi:hypothetical protein
MEHHRDDINDINPILVTHEFVHLIVERYLTKGHGHVPTSNNEGMAHNVAWKMYENQSNWISSLTDTNCDIISTSKTSVPELWSHEQQDEWTITAVSFLVNKNGVPKLIQYLESVNNDKNAFKLAFGITPEQFQKQYEDEVKLVRDKSMMRKAKLEEL